MKNMAHNVAGKPENYRWKKNKLHRYFDRFGITPNSGGCAELYLSPRWIFILQIWLTGVPC